MPSFDVVSEVDLHELSNAVDQANREIETRYDFKGSKSKITKSDTELVMEAESEFQLQQMLPIIQQKMTKRGIDITCLEKADAEMIGQRAKQSLLVKQGVDKDLARKMVKVIKSSKMKVQAAIQGEQVRITGKKRDDLQAAMALLKEQNYDLPLQFNNFRD